MKIYFAASIRGGRDDWTSYRSLSAMISGSNRVTLKEYQSPTELPEILEQFLQSK